MMGEFFLVSQKLVMSYVLLTVAAVEGGEARAGRVLESMRFMKCERDSHMFLSSTIYYYYYQHLPVQAVVIRGVTHTLHRTPVTH